ncbi:MAG: hypothetical protein AB9907_14830 [Flexilinea sp.]
MNALDFFDVNDWRWIKRHIQLREPFRFEQVNKKERVLFVYEGYPIPDNAYYRKNWEGSYLVSVNIVQNLPGNHSGSGHATDKFEPFATYEDFIRLADKELKGYLGYTPLPKTILPVEQLALF